MKQRDVRKYLFDMWQATELITQFAEGKTFHDYKSDPLLQSAVERQFEIIGEALNKALRLNPDLQGSIENASRIIAFRNRLIHGYSTISADTVWGIVEGNLSLLREELGELLGSDIN